MSGSISRFAGSTSAENHRDNPLTEVGRVFLGGARTLVSAQEVVAQLCLGLTEPQVWDVIKEIEAKGEYIFFGEGLDRRSRNLTKTEALKRWL